jgi:hypothetical protein
MSETKAPGRISGRRAGVMKRRRAAEVLGGTLPADPAADVLTLTTGQGQI